MTSIRKAKKLGIYIKPVKPILGIDIGIGCSKQTTSYWNGKEWIELQGVAKIHEGEPIIPKLARGGMIPEAIEGYIHAGETNGIIPTILKDVWKYRKKGKRYKKFLVHKNPMRKFAEKMQKELNNSGIDKVMLGDKTIYEREVLGIWN